MTKKIAPVAIQCLKEALTNIYWYKSELRSFLSHTLSDSTILSRLNWEDYKRNIVGTLIEHLVKNEDVYQRDIIHIMDVVSNFNDFSHLRRLEDGEKKVKSAKEAVFALNKQINSNQQIRKEQEESEKRREEAHKKMLKVNAVQTKLGEINKEFLKLLTEENKQKRGYILESVIKELFTLFDLDPKASFRITG